MFNFVLFFRIILDEATLHLSDKCNTVTVNLHRGKYVLDVTNELQSLKKQTTKVIGIFNIYKGHLKKRSEETRRSKLNMNE